MPEDKNKIKIRMATLCDARALAKIYEPYVTDTAISFEYEPPEESEFAARMENTLRRYPYLVAELDGEIAGYAYASPFIHRAAYDWSAELSIYVDMAKKGCGCGGALYRSIEKLLKKQNVLNINSCIAYTQHEDEHLTNDSMRFHSHMGFTVVGKFDNSGYKFKKWYDMIWMQKLVGEHRKDPEAFIPLPELKNLSPDGEL
jgi:phosphinothricin acetyltransferase